MAAKKTTKGSGEEGRSGARIDARRARRALFEWARNLDALFKETSLEWLNPIDGAKAAKLNREFEAPASFFPIATDGAGNYSCFDAATGRVMDWDLVMARISDMRGDLILLTAESSTLFRVT
jgi:hypothetical protein